MSERRVPCVGAIITGGGRILLIRRGHEPEAGRWSLPGGRIEAGETDQQALVREVREETGLEVAPGRLIGAVDRPAAGGRVLVISDYAATVTGGVLRAGDDADDARWFSVRELDSLPLSTGLKEALRDWGVAGPVPSHALIAEATRRAGVIWLAVPGRERPVPAWHIWRPGHGHRAQQGHRRGTGHLDGRCPPGGSGVAGVGRGHRPAGSRPAQRRPRPRLGSYLPARTGVFSRLTRSGCATYRLFTPGPRTIRIPFTRQAAGPAIVGVRDRNRVGGGAWHRRRGDEGTSPCTDCRKQGPPQCSRRPRP